MPSQRSSPSRVVRASRRCVEWLESRQLLSAFFVSPSGSDTATGAADQPWLTLQHAADTVAAGDTVTVRAGAYTGFRLTTDGTAAARITFKAETGVTVSPAVNNGHAIDLDGADHVTVEGFRIISGNAGIRTANNTGVAIRNNDLDLNSRHGILASASQSIVIENNVVGRTMLGMGIGIVAGADGAVIRNNRVADNLTSGILLDGDKNAAGSDGIVSGAVVEANTFLGNGRGGGASLSLDGARATSIRNNLIFSAHADGIALIAQNGAGASTGNTIINNTVVVAFDVNWALRVFDASTGTVIRNNILFNENENNGSITFSNNSLAGV